MLTQQQINSILKYIIFFGVIYIFTCFIDKKSVYFYLFVIFVLACFCKLAFYSNAKVLVRVSWGFLGFCLLALFATRINTDIISRFNNQKKFLFFDKVISILKSFGAIIQGIFTDTLYTYMFLFMVLGTLYASIISQGNPNYGVMGWILGSFGGFCIWFFLSSSPPQPTVSN